MLILSVLATFEFQRYGLSDRESVEFRNHAIRKHGLFTGWGDLLSFYLLRWWFLPVILIGRTYVITNGPLDLI